MSNKKKILISATIKEKPIVLVEYFQSLKNLEKDDFEISYFFIDDNSNPNASKLIYDFKDANPNVVIEKPCTDDENTFKENLEAQIDRTEDDSNFSHVWTYGLIDRIAIIKNRILEYAKENDFDYLFFVDSDIYLDPKTLVQLVSDEKDLVSNVFWTKWDEKSVEMPQVWLQDQYNMFNVRGTGSKEEQTVAFLNQLREPGLYKIGGLGACTLISKKVLQSGVNYDRITSVSFWGEDRYFSIRAEVLGFERFVDTHYPSFHIYREPDMEALKMYKKNILI
ncbi:MAG: glycosyltransferase [Clostridioides sp.]|jgi:hypothetical protein|nr:glycosyltransferase [Clostridioides sp.]